MKFENATLGELSVNGTGSYGIAASAVPYDKNLFTYLRITDINDDGTLNKSGLMSVDDDKAARYLLKPNDIVFARTGGSTGRNYFYDGTEGEFVFAGFLIKFSIDETKVNPRFVKYYCLSRDYKNWVNSFNTGSTRGNINAQTYANMPIPLPPRAQQDLLVETLSALDDKIELNNKINENLEQQAQAIFKSWFVDFEPFGGVMPDDWEISKVSDINMTVTDYVANGSFASLKANVTLHQEKSYAYFIRNTDLKSGTFNVFVDKHSYDFLAKSALYGGEIIISNVGDVGSVFLCPKLDMPMTLGNNVIMLRPNNEIYQYYLYIYFKWMQGQTYIQKIKGGSAQPKFNKTDFKNIPILIPSLGVLKKFCNISKSLFEKIIDNKQENQHLSALRDTLLPKLMNGEIDVSEVKI